MRLCRARRNAAWSSWPSTRPAPPPPAPAGRAVPARKTPVKREALLALCRASASCCAGVPGARQIGHTSGPTILRDIGFDQQLGESVPLDTAVPRRERAVRAARRLLRPKPGRAELVYYDCPMLCTLRPQRPGQRPRGAVVRARPGVRGRHRELRPEGDAGAGAAKKKAYLARYRPARRPSGLALPDRRRGADRSAHPGRRLPLRLGPGDAAVRAPRGIVVLTPDGASRATSTASSTRPRTCAWPWSRPRRARSARRSTSCLLLCYQLRPDDRPVRRRASCASCASARRPHGPGLGAFVVVHVAPRARPRRAAAQAQA